MECAACGASNEAGFNFCSNCGTALARVCPHCATSNGPGFNFCSNCGTSLTAESSPAPDGPPPSAPTADPGERRYVTVLFADLVGFTPFSESRDPEEVRGMLTRYFERAQQTIERFGGEVDKFIGDAVTAFWGAKVALEDDGERAVRAALELVDAVEELGEEIGAPGLELRAGVLSGETSVGSGGNETGLVVGDIVNTAARLQSIAAPGTVFVGESTRRLTELSIRYESAGEHSLKGKSDLITAWRAVDVVAERGGRGRSDGLEPPFVGREYEMRLLKDQLHAAAHERRARLVSIVGEGGIGKSRLGWELLKYVDGLADTFYWHQGRSPAYGEGVTFWALGEMVRQRARIAETDDHLKARTKLQTAIADLFPDPDEHRWITPRLAGLLGLDAMPDGDRSDLFAALRTFFQRVSERGPAVLVFEDLHWGDQGLLDFIVELVDRSQQHPLLVVTFARPSLLERRSDWGVARRGFTSAHLGPLADVDMAELVSGMAPGIEPDTVELIVRLAAGVPLYGVEYVRMLVATGDLVRDGSVFRQTSQMESLGVPDSLHAVVAARIDRLSPEERGVVQDAAVLGQSFTLGGLVAASDRSESELEEIVGRLVRAEVLRQDDDPRSPERGQFQFVQSVIREVAYGRLSKADRKQRHVRVARSFEDLDVVEFAAVIASHYLSALEAGPDDELAEVAIASLLGAARRAADLYSYDQCLTLVEEALQIPGESAAKVDLWILGSTAASHLFRHDVAIDLAQRAFDWQQDRADGQDVVDAARALGYAFTGAEQPGKAAALMAPVFEASRAQEPAMMRLGAELSRAYMLLSDMPRAADVARDTLVAAEAVGNLELVAETLNTRGTALSGLGRVHEALALLRESVRLGAEIGSPLVEARSINNFMVVNAVNGALANSEASERLLQLAERLGILDYVVRAEGRASWIRGANGRYEERIEAIERLDLEEGTLWRNTFIADVEITKWVLTDDHKRLDRADTVLAEIGESEEPQLEAWIANQRARTAFFRQDNAEAHRLFMSLTMGSLLPELDAWVLPTLCAIRERDAHMLESAWSATASPVGRRFEALNILHRAATIHLGGEPDRAEPFFVQAIEATEASDGEEAAMILRAIYAELAPDRATARAGAAVAYQWFTDVGANGYLQIFHDVWPLTLDRAEAG